MVGFLVEFSKILELQDELSKLVVMMMTNSQIIESKSTLEGCGKYMLTDQVILEGMVSSHYNKP